MTIECVCAGVRVCVCSGHRVCLFLHRLRCLLKNLIKIIHFIFVSSSKGKKQKEIDNFCNFPNRQSEKDAHFTLWLARCLGVWKVLNSRVWSFRLSFHFSFSTQLLLSFFLCTTTWMPSRGDCPKVCVIFPICTIHHIFSLWWQSFPPTFKCDHSEQV